MSDTNVQTVDINAMADLFPEMGTPKVVDKMPSFGRQEVDANLFRSSSTEETTTLSSSTEETTTLSSSTEDTTTLALNADGDADILGTAGKATVTTTPLADLSSYYQDRIKNGKFVAIEEEDDKGNKIPFIPKTAEEYDEVLELQISYRLDKAKKDLEKSWYESKSPAWKAVSQYAELVDDPTQLIPFLSGVRTIQSVANLDENEIDGAEQIVRTRLEQKGDPEEIIKEQIDALKTTNKLVSTAKQYKPLILQQEQTALASQMKREQDEQKKYMDLVSEIRTTALDAIEKPIFGKTKLKQEEKAAIYDLIAEPSEESQGYGIYKVIDDLFEKRDFETLKQVALLLSKKDSFFNYLGTTVANATAASLEKKLRLAGDSRQSSGNDFDEEKIRTSVTRNQFNTKPRFGR